MTDKLIETVKNYPLLYDPNSKDKDKKYEVWRQVAKESGLENGKIAKAKWRNIRDSYVKYVKARLDPDNPATKKYSKWPWAARLKFLNHHLYASLCIGNNKPNAALLASFQQIYCDNDSINFPDIGETSDENKDDFQIESEDFNEDSSDPADLCTNEIKQEMMESFPATINQSQTNPNFCKHPHHCKVPFSDPINLLFMSYAETVKKFSRKRQIEAKMQLATLINTLEREEILENGEH